MYSSRKTLDIAEHVSPDLAFRHSADSLFEYINSLEESTIVIDFSRVKSITRSFAHQYLANKKNSKKHIVEENMSRDVKRMFELVERQKSKPREMNTSISYKVLSCV
jgi:6-pyruvoyl-tetrahydropterin synthase